MQPIDLYWYCISIYLYQVQIFYFPSNSLKRASELIFLQIPYVLYFKELFKSKPIRQMFKISILIFSILLLVNLTPVDDSLAMQVGDFKSNSASSSNDFKNFEFINIHNKQKGDLNVLFTLQQQYAWQQAKLMAYKYDESVTLIQNCVGENNIYSCSIPQAQIRENMTILVAVTCQQQCKYTISSAWSNIQEIRAPFETPFFFGQSGKQQIFHLNLQKEDFKQIRINLHPETKRMPTDRVAIYGKYGYQINPTEQQHDFKSIDLWNQGQGVFLSHQNIKDKKISFLIVGEAETVYNLKVQLLTSYHHDIELNQTLNEHLFANSTRFYHAKVPKKMGTDYLVSISCMLGQIKVDSFIDKQMKSTFQSKPFNFRRDAKFIIGQKQQQYMTDLYFKVQSGNKEAVYVVYFQAKNQLMALQLAEYVDEYFIVSDEELAYFQFHEFQKENQQDSKSSEITVNIMNVMGQLQQQFRVCNGSLEQCTNKTTFKQHSIKIDYSDFTVIGLNKVYKLKIDSSYKKYINQVQKIGFIIIDMKVPMNSGSKSNPSQVIVSYMHNNQLQILRDKPLEDIIEFGQDKYYKFQFSDKLIQAIKIRLNIISGNAIMKSSRTDPRNQVKSTNKQIDLNSSQNPIIITQNVSEPIYIKVTGLAQTTFSLIPQIIHKTDGINNAISINQQIEFKIKIKPRQFEVFNLHPLYNAISFKYQSTGTIFACFLNQLGRCQTDIPQIGSQGQIEKNNLQKNQYSIRIGNPSMQRAVQIKVVYHSSKLNHCEQKSMGKLEHSTIKNNQCIGFSLDANSYDVEIYSARIDIGMLRTNIFLCQQNLQIDNHSPRFFIKKQTIQKYCSNRTATDKTLGMVFQGINSEQSLKVQYLVQYANNHIVIPDGLAYRMQEVSQQGPIKYFYYQVLNKIETSIKIKSFQGKATFFGKITPLKSKYTTQLNNQDFQFEPEIKYSTNPEKVIKPEQFQKQCPNVQCCILLVVYSQSQVGTAIDFSIQVTQNEVVLKDHIPYENALMKDSIAYYSYLNSIQNGTVIVQLSDNNQNCARIYYSATNFPSQSNYIKKQEGPKLVFSGSAQKYYLAVEAVQNCIYTITAFNSQYHLLKLDRGKATNLNMEKGDIQYFIFRHISNIGFRITTLHSYGNVRFYLNESRNEHIMELKNNDLSYKDFKVQHDNNLALEPQDKQFCFNCFYTLAAEAIEKTVSSVMLVDESTPVQITKDKILNDIILKKNQKSMAKFYGFHNGYLQLSIIKGKIEINVATQKQNLTKQILERKKQMQKVQFQLSGQNVYFWSPIITSFKCLEPPCIYTMILKNKQLTNTLSADIRQSPLSPGNPSYFFISSNIAHCFSGFIHSKNQKITLSTNDRSRSEILKSLDVEVKIGQNKNVSVHQTTVKNVMMLTFELQNYTFEKPQPFDMCVRNSGNQSFSGMAQQISNTNILPEDTEAVVKDEDTFIIYPAGSYLLDVFECSGEARLMNGTKQDQLIQDKSFTLTAAGMPNQSHAIKAQSFVPQLLKITSPLSLVRWFPFDEQNNMGVGYMKYKTGSLLYKSEGENLEIKIQALSVPEISKDKNYSITYKIYISNNLVDLKSASQCEKFLAQDVMVLQPIVKPEMQLNSQITTSIKKTNILEKFVDHQTIFINVVADLHLVLGEAAIVEDYRFLYSEQQIPDAIFTSNENNNNKIIQLVLFITLVTLSFLAFIGCTCLVTKKVVPLISRLRIRNMVQESQGRQGDQVIPPSSERQNIQPKKIMDDIAI